jgi:hypothetical protein
LRDWNVRINFGIKTGCNEAFIINGAKRAELIAKDPKSAEIIRPILRGRDVKRYGYDFADLYLIALFPSRRYDIEDFPAIKDYLLSAEWSDEVPNGHGKEKLEQTGKKHNINGVTFTARKLTGNKWFETQDQIGYWDDFSKQKIVWARLMRISKNDNDSFPRFAMVDDNYFVQDSLCLITGERLEYLLAVLNSEMATFQYFTQIVSLDDGGMQMRQQYIEQIPIPRDVLDIEAEIVETYRNLNGKNTSTYRANIDNAVFRLYGLNATEIAYIREYNRQRYEAINNR